MQLSGDAVEMWGDAKDEEMQGSISDCLPAKGISHLRHCSRLVVPPDKLYSMRVS